MPWQCIEEYEDTGTGYGLKRTYVYGNNIDEVLELEIVGVAKYYYHTNVQGNVVALTDEDGDIVEKFTYDVYGRLTAAEAWNGSTMVQVLDGDTDGDGDVDGDDDPAYLNNFIDAVELFAVSIIDNALLFQGRRYDEESGLYYFRNRQYDPVHGRFLSRDPESYKDSFCLYQFVNNNPVCYIDPMGTSSEWKSTDKPWYELYDEGFVSCVMKNVLLGGCVTALSSVECWECLLTCGPYLIGGDAAANCVSSTPACVYCSGEVIGEAMEKASKECSELRRCFKCEVVTKTSSCARDDYRCVEGRTKKKGLKYFYCPWNCIGVGEEIWEHDFGDKGKSPRRITFSYTMRTRAPLKKCLKK